MEMIRKLWMRLMGLSNDEIAESLRDDPPKSMAAERRQLAAIRKLDRITPPGVELKKFAVRY